MGAITIVLVLAVLAVILAMILGLWSMGAGGPFDKEHSVHFMYARIGLQAGAVVLMLLALWFAKG